MGRRHHARHSDQHPRHARATSAPESACSRTTSIGYDGNVDLVLAAYYQGQTADRPPWRLCHVAPLRRLDPGACGASSAAEPSTPNAGQAPQAPRRRARRAGGSRSRGRPAVPRGAAACSAANVTERATEPGHAAPIEVASGDLRPCPSAGRGPRRPRATPHRVDRHEVHLAGPGPASSSRQHRRQPARVSQAAAAASAARPRIVARIGHQARSMADGGLWRLTGRLSPGSRRGPDICIAVELEIPSARRAPRLARARTSDDGTRSRRAPRSPAGGRGSRSRRCAPSRTRDAAGRADP